jgi:hypothetical protein
LNRGELRGLRVALLFASLGAAVLHSAPAAAQDGLESEAGFEYLVRVGKLNLDYSRFEVAADALKLACATPEGIENFECYRLWATAAEKADRIGEALKAWDAAEAVAEQGNTLARDEASRIRSVYGEVILRTPWGRTLPSLPVVLKFDGLLLDPELKKYLARITREYGTQGVTREGVFLPGGHYTLDSLEFRAVPGERIELLLPDSIVPYRSAGVGFDRGPARAVAGPGTLGASFQAGAVLLPGVAAGAEPVRIGLQVRAGLRRGPLRLEARVRTGAVPTGTNVADPAEGDERAGAAWYVLGQGDVGVDIQAGAAWLLTPHLGGVGGTLGSVLIGCSADTTEGVRWRGECRVPTLVGGLQVGFDVGRLLGPVGTPARAELRFGLHVDVLRGKVVAGPGDAVGSLTLHTVDVDAFTVVAPGGEIGVSVRF